MKSTGGEDLSCHYRFNIWIQSHFVSSFECKYENHSWLWFGTLHRFSKQISTPELDPLHLTTLIPVNETRGGWVWAFFSATTSFKNLFDQWKELSSPFRWHGNNDAGNDSSLTRFVNFIIIFYWNKRGSLPKQATSGCIRENPGQDDSPNIGIQFGMNLRTLEATLAWCKHGRINIAGTSQLTVFIPALTLLPALPLLYPRRIWMQMVRGPPFLQVLCDSVGYYYGWGRE